MEPAGSQSQHLSRHSGRGPSANDLRRPHREVHSRCGEGLDPPLFPPSPHPALRLRAGTPSAGRGQGARVLGPQPGLTPPKHTDGSSAWGQVHCPLPGAHGTLGLGCLLETKLPAGWDGVCLSAVPRPTPAVGCQPPMEGSAGEAGRVNFEAGRIPGHVSHQFQNTEARRLLANQLTWGHLTSCSNPLTFMEVTLRHISLRRLF